MMDSRYRYVTDASILFDAVKGGILHEMFQLPFVFVTSDIVASRELKNPSFSEFQKAGLHQDELSGIQISRIDALRASHKALSVSDISVFLLALDQKMILLTGDEALRKFAESSGIQVHGILWILDELIRKGIISKRGASQALQQMIDRGCHLPKKECDERFSRWS